MHRATLNSGQIEPCTLVACQRGDREAFRVLYDAYKDKIYSLAFYFIGGDDAVAREIAQEVFLKLFSLIGQFRGGANFNTWLYRIVANVCMDECRRRKRLVQLDHVDAILASGNGTPEDDLSRKHVAKRVRDAVARLKPKLRLPIVLRYVEELSYEEIAAALGCSQGTIASRLSRAHRTLAGELEHLLPDIKA
jgi:RNA polymerase sigma-70 factor, ECF subfamily